VVIARSNNWYQSQGHEFDFQRVIAEGEIVAGGSNYPVAEARWAESQSNRGAWVITLLSKKSLMVSG